jgi:thiosulfate dehydrogenase [quinone] large subunit
MSGSRKSIRTLFLVWLVMARELTGLYWLYFGVQKWSNYGWVRDTLTSAALNNPIPLYGEFLRNFVLPNWGFITVLETVAETLVGLGLIFGLFTRLSGLVGVLMATNLTLTMAFSFSDFALIFWYCALSLVLNVTVLLSDTGRIFGLDRFILKRFRPSRVLSLIV